KSSKKIFTLSIILIFLSNLNIYAQDNVNSNEKNSQKQENIINDELVPPVLKEYVEAVYPKESAKKGVEADVLTEISIDENGIVTGVAVVESAGQAFDDAAVDAIYQFLFSPALKDGVPIPSKVLYKYSFFLKPDESIKKSEEETPVSAILKGKILDMEDKPIKEVSVLLTSLDMNSTTENSDTPEKYVTSSDGTFEFKNLNPGMWQIDIVAASYKPLSLSETIEEGETRELIYRLEPEQSTYETIVRDRKPPREVTRREISRREITRIPGTGGDALRAVQNLPGMARAPGFSGQLLVRGSSPEDSKYFFDEMPIPMLYHFGGMTSVINSDLLDSIDYFPGNFSVKYGNATGGIIDVYPKKPETDRFHGYVDADIWDVSALLQFPVNKNWSLAMSARRSYIDSIIGAVMPKDGGFQFTIAPRYYDYQFVADYHADGKDNLRLFIFGSDDKAVLLFGDQVLANPNFSGGVNFRTLFHQAQLKWNHKFNKKVSNEFNFGVGFWNGDNSLGDTFKFNTKAVPFFLRDEMEWKAGDHFILRTGVDLQVYWSKWSVVSATSLPREGEHMDPVGNGEPLTSDGEGWFFWPALYTEMEFIPVKDLRIIPGVRLGWYDQIREFGADPRLTVRYRVFRHTTFKGGVGLFNQAPNTAVADKEFGNPDLKLTKAMHYSAGIEQDVTSNINLSLEGFYKNIWNLVVSGQSGASTVTGFDSSQTAGPLYTNEGKGSVYGFELLLKHTPTDRFFGWIAYTFMQSTRVDHKGEDKRPFDYDQTHILTVVASAVLGMGWEAGIRFRLVSGNPYTPINGSVYDSDSDTYWPIWGQSNSDRLPPFHQLDVRIDKIWTFKHMKFSVYLDIQNVYNRKNLEGHQFNYDYSQRVDFYGLPIIPSIGMKLEY
ncbi:MAG: TonB family protein, partial [Deltaproteobacteria bacterium]|nr:TonB family protein [Deltaproteobacteria bacterium]